MFCDSRQQKQAKEEERALKAADKAAEEAAAKARQAALDEEIRKKREDERTKRETFKKAMEEEKARKEEDKKKRAQEEREREQERDRKKREKEEKTKKEREEKERKAKEEREARLAKEKEEKDRLEREKVEKDRKAKEKAEKEAKEKLAAQQRTAAAASASASTLASGSSKGSARANNAVASSSTASTPVKSNSSSTSSVAAPSLQRLPNNSSGSIGNDSPSKKPANKPNPTLVTSPLPPGILGQGPRPAVQQPNLSRPSHLPSPTPIISQQPHLPQPLSTGMMYGHPQGPVGMSPSAMSPRVGTFPPMVYGYGGPNMHPPPLSPVPARGFNGGTFDPTFNRGIPIVPIGALPPLPIGPPTKAAKSATQGPTSAGLAPGQGRHVSAGNDASGPGPITRPMAPIARPAAGGGEAASSGSGSPNRRSPSPSRVLGSSALAADDDEVVSAHGPRRATSIGIGTVPIGGGPGGQNWGSASPRTALSEANLRSGPWTASAFSSARTTIGTNNHLHQLHHPGPVSPSMWGNAPGNGNGENWHPQSPGFFSGPPYINHNATAPSTPHTST